MLHINITILSVPV